MAKETNDVRKQRPRARPLDGFDRRISAELVRDATQSYATIGEAVGLSTAAVHERVKRLRASGVVRSTSALLNGTEMGKPVLAFIHVQFAGWGKSHALMEFAEVPEIEEMHSATGDTGLIIKARAANAHALESLLAKLHQLHGVAGTKTYITLSTFIERPVQAEITQDWDVDILQGPTS